jgi:hypothetical protein
MIHTVKNGNQLGKTINHLFLFAKLVFIVEIGTIYDAFQIILFRQSTNDDIGLGADFLVPLHFAISPNEPSAGTKMRAFGSPAYLSDTYLTNSRVST